MHNLTIRFQKAWVPVGLLAIVLLASCLVYWPGTKGGFWLDDYPNIVNNASVHIHHLNFPTLLQAVLSSKSSPLKRPLSMLSFALNEYFTGNTPGPMLATNIFIHLLNGLLIFFLANAILRRLLRSDEQSKVAMWISLAVTAAWLLAPINLTAVLYIVQRMTSLSAFFTLGGLLLYFWGRSRRFEGHSGLWPLLLAALVFFPLAVAAKGTGILLMAYAFVIEFTLFGFRDKNHRWDKAIIAYFGIFLAIPVLLGLIWLLPHILRAQAWNSRRFDLMQRLLTEPRVFFFYLYLIIAPNLSHLSLYHDAYAVSHGFLHPATTILAILGVICLFGVALKTRNRHPLISFGILWFLAGQALTGTFLPLDLVFEHREYLPDFGIFLVLFGLLLAARPLFKYKHLRVAAAFALVLLYGGVTALRVHDWSNPLLHASLQARYHPNSPRATYSLARLYAILAFHNPALTPKAETSLQKAMRVHDQGILPESALIILAAHSGLRERTAWFQSIRLKLTTQPLTPESLGALNAIVRCGAWQHKPCNLPSKQMTSIFKTAIRLHHNSGELQTIYGNYLLNVEHKLPAALQILRKVANAHPAVAPFQINDIVANLMAGRISAAEQGLKHLRKLNHLGILNQTILHLQHDIRHRRIQQHVLDIHAPQPIPINRT